MNINDFHAIIFDLDGTLIDSMWVWKQIDIDYLAKKQIEFPLQFQSELDGMSFTETAVYFKEHFQLEDSVEAIKQDWIDMSYQKYTQEVMLKKGVLPFLQFLADLNIPMGIGTSSNRQLAEGVLCHHQIDGYFSSLRTSCEVEAGKPNPAIFLKVAEDLGVEPKNCLVFEDTLAGIQAAKRAGMAVIAIHEPAHAHRRDEIQALADDYLDNFHPLLNKISR
jgi:HAD superfamily hydrolase (TIGR01509 family)